MYCKVIVSVLALVFGACGNPVKSSIAAQRNKAVEGISLTAKDYVQDGLVAMWDGIENAGWGLHDANATVWKDLTMLTGDAVKVGSPTWTDNAGVTSGFDNIFQVAFNNSSALLTAVQGGNVTVEICFSHDYPTFSIRSPLSIEDSDGSSSTYRILQVFQYQQNGYQSAWFNKNATNLSSATPEAVGSNFGTYSVTVSVANPTATIVPYWNGDIGVGITQDQTLSFTFDPTQIETFGVSTWYLRIGRTHNTFMNARFHSIRIYSRALTAEEIAHNYAVDKERFNLP